LSDGRPIRPRSAASFENRPTGVRWFTLRKKFLLDYRKFRTDAALPLVVVEQAPSLGVIARSLEVPARWARLAAVGIPIVKTIPVPITIIAKATPFGDVHDVRLALKKAKWIVRCGDRCLRSDRAQQRKRH
jgi:hypothetical protein